MSIWNHQNHNLSNKSNIGLVWPMVTNRLVKWACNLISPLLHYQQVRALSQLNNPVLFCLDYLWLSLKVFRNNLHLEFVQNMWLDSKFKNRYSSRSTSHQIRVSKGLKKWALKPMGIWTLSKTGGSNNWETILSWHINISCCQNIWDLLHKGVKITFVRLIISSVRNPFN